MSVARTWGADLARRLGIRGTVEKVDSSVGVILQIPCATGRHIVDVKIRPNLDPNGTAKQMLNAGWRIGHRKLTCPDCQPRREGLQRGGKRGGRNRMDAMTPEERSEFSRQGAKARWATQQEGKDLVMGEPPASEKVTPEAKPSKAAGHGRRMIYLELEEAYDEPHQRYKDGWSDERVAKETGMALVEVTRIREADFGPLGEPPELAKLRAALADANEEAAKLMAHINGRFESISKSLAAICTKNGWPVP